MMLAQRGLRRLGLGNTPAKTSWPRRNTSFVGEVGGEDTILNHIPSGPSCRMLRLGLHILCTSRSPLARGRIGPYEALSHCSL